MILDKGQLFQIGKFEFSITDSSLLPDYEWSFCNDSVNIFNDFGVVSYRISNSEQIYYKSGNSYVFPKDADRKKGMMGLIFLNQRVCESFFGDNELDVLTKMWPLIEMLKVMSS